MNDPQASQPPAATPAPAPAPAPTPAPSEAGAPAPGQMTRLIVVWKPEFETATYRKETIESTRVALAAKAPWVVEGRTLELKKTAHKDIYRKCNHWLTIHWSRKLQNPQISVVVLGDPAWNGAKEKFDAAVKAVVDGNPGTTGRPTLCVFGVETTEAV